MTDLRSALELVIDLAAQSVDEEEGETRDGQEAACDAVEALATALFGKEWRTYDWQSPKPAPHYRAPLAAARQQIEDYMHDRAPPVTGV